MKPLFDYLAQIQDFRRAQGKRIGLASFLEMVILSGMSGRFSINGVARFIKSNEEFFINRYKLEHGVPGKTTVFKILRDLPYEALNEALFKWVSQFVDTKEDIWMALDGKAISSTLSDKHNSKQNYKSIISLFSNKLGLVVSSASMENKKTNEGKVAQQLIEDLELQGVTLTLDALHCQKKPRKLSWIQEMSM